MVFIVLFLNTKQESIRELESEISQFNGLYEQEKAYTAQLKMSIESERA